METPRPTPPDIDAARQFDLLRDCLYRVGRVMENVDDLDRLLLTIIEECKTLLNCESASIALHDPEKGDLAFTVASGGSDKIKQWRMAMGQGIVGQVAVSREAIISNDPRGDKRWFTGVDEQTGFVSRNLAAAPITRGEDLIGVLEVLNRPGEEGFGEDDLILLQIFADHVGIALETERLIQAKQQSERLATFGVALADIGHSVKNILMRLQFPTKLIEQAADNEDWKLFRGAWPTLQRATDEISSLVHDMLNYSRAREPETCETDVIGLLDEIVESYRPDAQSKSVALETRWETPELTWPLDPKALKYGLTNLIGNAIEAIAEHGGAKVTVRVQLKKGGEEMHISIADDGPGMPPEIQKRIFDPFFSTKKSKGTGLGLANVKKGVEEHGGRVLLETEPRIGSMFTLVFPKTP